MCDGLVERVEARMLTDGERLGLTFLDALRIELEGGTSMELEATCEECGRRFDLTDENDADEWAYGHDCEPDNPREEWTWVRDGRL